MRSTTTDDEQHNNLKKSILSEPTKFYYYVYSSLMYLVFLICGLSTFIHLSDMTRKIEMDKKSESFVLILLLIRNIFNCIIQV